MQQQNLIQFCLNYKDELSTKLCESQSSCAGQPCLRQDCAAPTLRAAAWPRKGEAQNEELHFNNT